MTWRVAGSLTVLLRQVNTAYPGRSKASDGTIGDRIHQAQGQASDHNPWVIDAKGIGVVRALDVTHDPAHGLDTYALAERMRLARDPRVTYLISNRRITGPAHAWRWGPYTEEDPHTGHLHVSVSTLPALYDAIDPWEGIMTAPPPDPDVHFTLTHIHDPADPAGVVIPEHVAEGRQLGDLEDLTRSVASLALKIGTPPVLPTAGELAAALLDAGLAKQVAAELVALLR